MADTLTPVLGIIELQASQSQPEIPVNEAIRILEAFADRRVISASISVPPVAPSEGDSYIVADSGSGVWTLQDGNFATFIGGAWFFVPKKDGWLFYDGETDSYIRHSSGGSPSGWVPFP